MTKRSRLGAIAALFAAATVPTWISPVVAQQTDRAKQIGGKLMCGV